MYAGGPVALLILLPLGKMSPRYLELNRLLDFFTAPDELTGICSIQTTTITQIFLAVNNN